MKTTWVAVLLAAAAWGQTAVPLEGETHHVQGLLVDGERFWVTSVDRVARKGYLFEFERATGKRLRAVELQQGSMFHPGGLDGDGTSLWIPVAEYKPLSRTVIQKRSKATLELEASFEVADHIGCVAVQAAGLVGGNWDGLKLYGWSFEGKQISVRRNPGEVRFQDLKWRDGVLVASGLLPKPKTGGAVQWLDWETLTVLEQRAFGVTDRGTALTHEGMDLAGGALYFLPEDAPSRVFAFTATHE